MKTFALLMVLFFADGVENPRPQFINGLYPMVIEEDNCERAVKSFEEQLEGMAEAAANGGQTFPHYRVTCDPIEAYVE